MSMTPTEIVDVVMTGGPQGASIVGPPGPAGNAYAPVSAAWDQNVALTGIQNLDSVTGVANQRVLLTGQTTASQNGIWLQQAGAWTRPGDFPTATTPTGSMVTVLSGGTVWGRSLWTLATTGVTIDTTAQVWVANTVPNIATKVHRAAILAVNSNTDTLVTFDTKVFDTGNNFSLSTHLFTAPYPGWYLVHGQVRWSGSIAQGTASIYKNQTSGQPAIVGYDATARGASISQELLLVAGDTLGLDVFQNAVPTAGTDTGFGGTGTFLDVRLLRLNP